MKRSTPRTTPVPATRNKSWAPGRKGQGGEGMSKGHGGSAGPGTGPSGPETERPNERTSKPAPGRDEKASPCLPTRETIERVLR